MRIFKRNKNSVTLLDEKWNVVVTNMKFNTLPRIDELIFMPKEQKYYSVINVIYNMYQPVETYLIVEPHSNDNNLI